MFNVPSWRNTTWNIQILTLRHKRTPLSILVKDLCINVSLSWSYIPTLADYKVRNIAANWISGRLHHIMAAGKTYNTAVRAWNAAPKKCVATSGRGKRFLLLHIIETGFGADAASYSIGTRQNGRDLKPALPPPPTAKAWIGGAILYTTIRCHGLWTGKLNSYFYNFTHTRMVTKLFDKNCSPSSQHCPILSKFVQDICFVLNNT